MSALCWENAPLVDDEMASVASSDDLVFESGEAPRPIPQSWRSCLRAMSFPTPNPWQSRDTPEGEKFGSMLDVRQIRLAADARIRESLRGRRLVVLQNQRGVVAQLAQILERLEDVLLSIVRLGRLHLCLDRLSCLRIAEFVVKLLLDVGEFAVVVLDDLRREVVQDVLLQPP
jgi:hypothetical protein